MPTNLPPAGDNSETLFLDTVQVFDCEPVSVLPGTKAPPRPPGKERPHYLGVVVPGGDSAAAEAVAALLTQVQRVVDGMPANSSALDTLRQVAAELARVE